MSQEDDMDQNELADMARERDRREIERLTRDLAVAREAVAALRAGAGSLRDAERISDALMVYDASPPSGEH